MNYTLSRHVRRFVGRLSKGEYLVEAFERLCKRENIRSGAIRAIGVLRHVALQTYGGEEGYATQLDAESTFELTSLEGNISTMGDQIVINCYVQVATRTLEQWQVFGGRLYEGEAITVEFVVEVFDDVLAERRLDARVGLPTWETLDTRETDGGSDATAPVPAPPSTPAVKPSPPPAAKPIVQIPGPKAGGELPKVTPPAPGRAEVFSSEEGVSTRASTPEVVRRRTTKMAPKAVEEEPVAPPKKPISAPASDDSTWADAVKASEQVRTSNKLAVDTPKVSKKAMVDDWRDVPELSAGDLLKHPHFGLCKIIYLEEDDFVRVRMRSGKVVDIKLEVCEITPAGDQNGTPLFDCKIVRR